jgi:hypothetical protein
MIQYRFKNPPEKKHGEFLCPYCNKVFFTKISLSGHIGGAHRKDITSKTKKPYCKFCDAELVEGKNWPKWAIKQQNLICVKCKRLQNRLSYYRKKDKRKKNLKDWQNRLKKMAENKKLKEQELL